MLGAMAAFVYDALVCWCRAQTAVAMDTGAGGNNARMRKSAGACDGAAGTARTAAGRQESCGYARCLLGGVSECTVVLRAAPRAPLAAGDATNCARRNTARVIVTARIACDFPDYMMGYCCV